MVRRGRAVVPDPDLCPKCVRREEEAQQRRNAETLGAQSAQRVAGAVTTLELMELAGGNPWEYGQASFATVQPWSGRERAFEAARVFAVGVTSRADRYQRAANVLLWGETGLGKTLFAHCALVHVLEAGISPGKGVLFVRWPQFVKEVQDTYSAKEKTWPLIRRLHEADVVFLDDVFRGKVTPDVLELLCEVLDGRAGRWTFISMNPNPATIRERWGHLTDDVERLVSRLGPFRVVNPVGDDDGRFKRSP